MVPPLFTECDFHVHTALSGEKQAAGFTLERLFETADALGLRYVGYSEHWHPGTSPDLFLRIRDEVARLQPRFACKVFVSAEIDVLNSRGDMSFDPVEAAGILDYVSAAISHYGVAGSEQLLPDRVEDTLAMIEAVCKIPEVTMLMHPQIVYGHSVAHIDAVVPPEVYAAAARAIADAGKVVDYASVEMSLRYLRYLEFDEAKLDIFRESWRNYTDALVQHAVLLSPGTDAHNVSYWNGPEQWFGNNALSWQMLRDRGFDSSRLWYGVPLSE